MNIHFIKKYMQFDNEYLPLKKLVLYTFLIYSLGIVMRMILMYQAGQIGPLWHENMPIAIWTPDAGRYGFYAKEILSGINLPFHGDYLLGYMIAYVSQILHLPIDWTMVLLPAFVAPLIAIPMVMMGTVIKQPVLALLSALVAVNGIFYYSRSHIGYMDTDSINLFLILMAIAWIMKGVAQKKLLYAYLATATLILFDWWYHSATIINVLIIGTSFIYILLFARKDKTMLSALLLLTIAIAPISVIIKFIVLTVLFPLLLVANRRRKVDHRVYGAVIVIGAIVALLVIDPAHYLHRASAYLAADDIKSFTGKGITYYYLNDLKFVSEVTGVELWNAFAPLFISVLYVIVATIGYVLFLFGYRLFLLTLPLMLLGYMSSFAGSRFAMFATPVLAFGFIYLLFLLRALLAAKYGKILYIRRLPYYGTTLVWLLMVYNIFTYNTNLGMGLQFYSKDKEVLEAFSKRLTSADSIVSWWDYGWPLWYYTGHNITFTDNGQHGGADTHIVAQMLISKNPYFTANAARFLGQYRTTAPKDEAQMILPDIAKEYNLTALLEKFKQHKKIDVPSENGNVYILLHQNMLSYYGTIRQFAYWDMLNKKYNKMATYRVTPVVRPFSHNYSLLEGYGYILDSTDGKLMDAKGNKTPVNMLMIARNNTRKESFLFHNSSNINILDAKGLLMMMDKDAYSSFYIQAMLLDVYDRDLFEKVGETGRIKIFRVKKPNEHSSKIME